MGSRAEEQLKTLDQLLTQQSVKKACTIGLIIDSSNAYYDHKEKMFVKKIKIIDQSMNPSNTTANFRYGYCTVMFFAESAQALPNPYAIGDLIYLRRFAFNIYSETFQGNSNPGTYCSWALLNGDINNKDFAQYQLSRNDLILSEEKYNSMFEPVRELREFGRRFLEKNSIVTSVPAGVTPKDSDMIVQVIRKNEQGIMRVRSSGKKQMILRDCQSFVQEKQIGKLRSVAEVRKVGNQLEIIKNNFTSLLRLPEWTADAQTFLQNDSSMDIESDENMYTPLSFLNTAALSQCENKKYFVKCQVFGVSVKDFKSAVKFYDAKKNTVYDNPHDGATPVYKFQLQCQDGSIKSDKNSKFSDVWIFSNDGQGSDFVERVKLGDLNQFSSWKQEGNLFNQRVDQVLEAESVIMTVQVLSDGKGNRALRALNIKC